MARRTRAERREQTQKRKDEVLRNLAKHIEKNDRNARLHAGEGTFTRWYKPYTEEEKRILIRQTVRNEGSMFFDDRSYRCGDCTTHACDWCVGNAYAKHERQFSAMDDDLRAYVCGDYDDITDADGNVLYDAPDAAVYYSRKPEPLEWKQV